ncbi:glutathione S-transferase 1-like [Battus philenor]|uniref:glutathione S-transferase 1-like n=1 Tax=Battus philenor TaxID=42288 RepID=UPI0035CF329B
MSPLLYKNNVSPPSRTVMMVADILGLDLNMEELNPMLQEQATPEFTKKNPMRTIPILEEEGFNLADSHAIILYLFDKNGKAEHECFYPCDKRKRATVNQRLFFDCGVLFPRLKTIMGPIYGGRLTELSRSMIRNVDDAYRILETYLSHTLYLADDVITLADICILTTISTLHGLHPIDGKVYPKLKQWYTNMSQQEYCKRINESGSQQHVDVLKKLMKNNKNKSKL